MTQKRILFLGTHGQHNIGDELLLDTFLTQLGSENHYFVNSYDPTFTEAQLRPRFQVDVFHTTGEPLRFLRYLLSCDLIFFGGGSIIKELYASVGRGRYATLLMVLLTVTFARQIARKPVIMSNIGVGPIETTRGKRLSTWILKQVNLLSVRDETSYQTCLTLGLDPRQVHQVSDVVFVNNAQAFMAETDNTPTNAVVLSRPVRVALNLNYDIENPANWDTFLQNLEEGLRGLNERQPIEIHALPMQSAFKAHDDWAVLAEFRQRIPEIEMHLHRPETFQEVAAILSECDLLISERLHSIVVAAILGKPCLALTYDVKVRELVAMLNIQEHALEINRPFDPALLTDRAEALLRAPDIASHHLLHRAATLRSEMDAYVLNLQQHLETLACR
jgi:polysaccharide pyruvyl transferase WcaK-like protein